IQNQEELDNNDAQQDAIQKQANQDAKKALDKKNSKEENLWNIIFPDYYSLKNSKENDNKISNINNSKEKEHNYKADDKSISKNKDIFHKYTKSFSIINKKGKTYRATTFIKNTKKYFILNNGDVLSIKKYQRTYQQKNNVKKVKVINHSGVNIYRNINFSKRNLFKHAKFNQKFKVIAVKHLNYDITRYKLSNGLFITTHKNFVKVIK
ncbi:DUF5776 domain-containing protein, partial [Apilactobacillus sp. TMW 2.2459]|uniref:DUF5776 domain-containing protein n=1 Tax=Apilactobacillus xinyiensis TaxID=2841032 RepID=UPI00200EF01C